MTQIMIKGIAFEFDEVLIEKYNRIVGGNIVEVADEYIRLRFNGWRILDAINFFSVKEINLAIIQAMEEDIDIKILGSRSKYAKNTELFL